MSVLVLGTVNRVLQTISCLALADCMTLVRACRYAYASVDV